MLNNFYCKNWSAYISYTLYTRPLHMHAPYRNASLAIRVLLVYKLLPVVMCQDLLAAPSAKLCPADLVPLVTQA